MSNAILITYPQEDSLKEALALSDASGYKVIKTVTQRHLTKSRYGIGAGKAEEVKEYVEALRPDVVIFDEILKSVQIYNLAKMLQIEIIDRERLILGIFERRASTAESRIQVKLAQLRYEMTRAREKVKLARKGEQPGFFGLGRYEVDDYYRDIHRRVTTLKQKLAGVSRRRDLYRYQRSKHGLHSVSLAGYTSAGKTTLFNSFTGETHDSGKGMFTTLSTYTRALHLKDGKTLVSDTVGFISKLPAYMIEAFKSTLDELTYSDLVLLVIDISEPLEEIKMKYDSCIHVLNELNVPQTKVLNVLNKIDLTSEAEALEKAAHLDLLESRKYVIISAKNGYNIEQLKEMINAMIFDESPDRSRQKSSPEEVGVEKQQIFRQELERLGDVHGLPLQESPYIIEKFEVDDDEGSST
jgi:GTP-binding protein HflX